LRGDACAFVNRTTELYDVPVLVEHILVVHVLVVQVSCFLSLFFLRLILPVEIILININIGTTAVAGVHMYTRVCA
jgi:hypothetical protein